MRYIIMYISIIAIILLLDWVALGWWDDFFKFDEEYQKLYKKEKYKTSAWNLFVSNFPVINFLYMGIWLLIARLLIKDKDVR